MMSRSVLVAHPSPDLYGSDRMVLESVVGLVDAGCRVVVSLPADGPLVPALREAGAEVCLVPTPVLRKSFLSPTGLVRLAAESCRGLWGSARLLRRTSPDTVLVNTITVPLWTLAARLAGRPVVVHVHEAEGSASPLVRKVLYAPLLLADRLLVNSQFALRVLTESYPGLSARSKVVPNGVYGPASASGPRSRLDGQTRLLFVGRLSPRKGPQVALAALERLVAAGVPVRLGLLGAVFPGYEWFEEELHAFVRDHGLEAHVDFLGFEPDVWPRIAEADIVVVPSTVDEPFGNTAVEAILAHRPLVVSATSGLLEAAEGYRTARRVQPDDAGALADAVRELIGDWDEVLRDIGQDADLARRRHAVEGYRSRVAALILGTVAPNSAMGTRPTPWLA